MLYNVIIIIFFVFLSGLFSGLNLALMGLRVEELEIEAKSGNKDAEVLIPIRKRGNQLLCTMLFGNVLVNTTLSVFLGNIMVGIFAIIIGTFLITVFGAIIPQSVISRYSLSVGARLRWVVYFFLFILSPITLPIAKILDHILGDEFPKVYSKRLFKNLIEYQENLPESDIGKIEKTIMKGGLGFSDKKVKQVMTPRRKIFFLNADSVIGPRTIKEINKSGRSRMPVYDGDKDNVIGLLYSKDLVEYNPEKKLKARDFMRNYVKYVSEDAKLDFVLKMFKQKKFYLFMVRGQKGTVKGIVSVADILQAILGEVNPESEGMEEIQER